MKIALISVGYQCHKRFAEVIAPWMILKFGILDEYGLMIQPPHPDLEIVISATTAQFKEYADLGFTYNNYATEMLFKAYHQSGTLDYINIIKEPIIDFQSRNYCWNDLKNLNADITWQLDLFDEVYTVKEILNIIKFIKENPMVDWYGVNFKNYVGDEHHYVEGFCPPRIHWVKRHDGIQEWIWDNDLKYKDGTDSRKCSNLSIPQNIAFVDHFSWCGDKEFLQKKISYQHRAIGCCGYSLKDGKLVFNEDYYNKVGQHHKPIILND